MNIKNWIKSHPQALAIIPALNVPTMITDMASTSGPLATELFTPAFVIGGVVVIGMFVVVVKGKVIGAVAKALGFKGRRGGRRGRRR